MDVFRFSVARFDHPAALVLGMAVACSSSERQLQQSREQVDARFRIGA